jgi:hypothetical protein
MTKTVNPQLFRIKKYTFITSSYTNFFNLLNQLYIIKRNIYFFIKFFKKSRFCIFYFKIQKTILKVFKLFFFGFFFKRHNYFFLIKKFFYKKLKKKKNKKKKNKLKKNLIKKIKILNKKKNNFNNINFYKIFIKFLNTIKIKKKLNNKYSFLILKDFSKNKFKIKNISKNNFKIKKFFF